MIIQKKNKGRKEKGHFQGWDYMKSTHSFTFWKVWSQRAGRQEERSASLSWDSVSAILMRGFGLFLEQWCRSYSSVNRQSPWMWKGYIARILRSLPLGEQQRSRTQDCFQFEKRKGWSYQWQREIADIWFMVGIVPRKAGFFWQIPTILPSMMQTRYSSFPDSRQSQYCLNIMVASSPSSHSASVIYSDILASITSSFTLRTFLSSCEQSLAVLLAILTKTLPPSSLMMSEIYWWGQNYWMLGLVSSLVRQSMDLLLSLIERVGMEQIAGIWEFHQVSTNMGSIASSFMCKQYSIQEKYQFQSSPGGRVVVVGLQVLLYNLTDMNEPIAHYLRPTPPPKSSSPSKQLILEWLSSIVKDYPHRIVIEQLGDGEIYCRIINHYIPGTISANRIISSPKNQYQFMLNLKQLQNALSKLRLSIYFDIQKISRQKFNENWALVCLLYKALEHSQCKKGQVQVRKDHLEEMSEHSKQIPLEISSKINQLEPLHPPQNNKTPFPASFFPLSQDFPRGSLLFTVDRVKEILLSNTHDTEKIRLIRGVFGLQNEVKVQEDESSNQNSIRFV